MAGRPRTPLLSVGRRALFCDVLVFPRHKASRCILGRSGRLNMNLGIISLTPSTTLVNFQYGGFDLSRDRPRQHRSDFSGWPGPILSAIVELNCEDSQVRYALN